MKYISASQWRQSRQSRQFSSLPRGQHLWRKMPGTRTAADTLELFSTIEYDFAATYNCKHTFNHL
jgi:hypothetical protein